MARDQEEITVTSDDWIELTNADATVVAFQVISLEDDYNDANGVFVRVSTNKPNVALKGFRYRSKEFEGEAKLTLSDIGSGTRLWAKATNEPVVVVVTHA